MTERVNYWLNIIFNFGVMALALLTPFFFWNLTSEFYETPKFILLIAITGILLVLWIAKGVFAGKLTVARTSLDLPFILLLAVFGISTFFSPTKTVSILGNLPRIHGGLATFAAYIILYFTLVSNFKQISVIKQLIYLLLGSGVVLSILSLLSYFGVNVLTLPWTAGLNFTPTGSSFSTAAILALLLPFPLMIILQDGEKEVLGNMNSIPRMQASKSAFSQFFPAQIFNKVLLTLVLVLFTATIALIGSWATYIAAAAAFALAFFTTSPLLIKKNAAFVLAPLALAVVLIFVSLVPMAKTKNPLYNQAQNFPREVQLPFQTSWKVSISTFRDAPFWGTGPASYLSDFTTYKPAEFNATKLWNIRFDTAFNEYLQTLATLGALGLIALILLTVVFVSQAFKALAAPSGSINLSLAISGITLFVLLALHTSTLPLMVIGIILLAAFMASGKRQNNNIQIGLTTTQTLQDGVHLHFDALPAIILLIVLALVGTTYYFTGKLVLADFYHRQALQSVAAGRGLDAYNQLIAAEKLNSSVDLYRSDMAQTNFALANAIAAAKGPTEASPSGSLTDADKQNIQTLLSQAIAEGQAAAALNPRNPLNWEILGSIYRQISGVAQNALTFSLDSYGRAIQQDPMNPSLRLTVGGIYYSVKNYDMAIRFFSDAVNLKPDFANAYFNLAVALKDKGDLVGAATSAERTVSLLDPGSQDYQVASDLLKSLKDQIASAAAKQQAEQEAQQKIQAPAAQTPSSALQNKNLPNVLDLPKPENVATPPAVKKEQ